MPDNRSVGRPTNNRDRMQPRDVPVAHDKPRLNDQRKVSPHQAGDPRLGVRPSGGAQKGTKTPALNQSFMQKRDVAVEKMTEAELAELNNPFSRFFKAKRDFIPGDAVGYMITKHGIDLYHVKDGFRIGAAERKDSYETMTKKLADLKQQYADLKDQRRELSINPKRAAIRMAQDWARQQGFVPHKIGEMNTEIPSQDNGPAAGPPAPPAAATPAAVPKPAAAPSTSPAASGAPSGTSPPYQGNVAGKSSMNGGPSSYSAKGSFTQPMGGGAPSAKPSPANEPTASPEPEQGYREKHGPADTQEVKNFLYKHAPEYFPTGSLEALTPYQVGQNYQAFMGGKMTAMMKKNRALAQSAPTQMAAEGYPDTSFERDEPSHESKIRGNFYWTNKAKGPGTPDLNREFAQFDDLQVEKVNEIADQEISAMLNRMVSRMGYTIQEEAEEPAHDEEDEARSNPFKKRVGLDNFKKRVGKDGKSDERPDTQFEARIARTRSRWV